MNTLENVIAKEVMRRLVFEFLDIGSCTEGFLDLAQQSNCPNLGVSLIFINGLDDLGFHCS
jgi:hypothetical protein